MMRLENKIGVIIATSLNRCEFLFTRAIPSVLSQTYKPDFLLVVDDNTDKDESERIVKRLRQIQQEESFTGIQYLLNQRTQGMSGTGSWNTGLDFYKHFFSDNDFIAILDDDDEWERSYLESCVERIAKTEPDQIVAFIKRTDCKKPNAFTLKDLCVQNFLTGNPGVQGSNMFFKLSTIKAIGGFDESFASCTDRDFMLSFLTKVENPKIEIIQKVLVHHYAGKGTVTYDMKKKENGLDSFYKKYIRLFSLESLEKSLGRAQELFSYCNTKNIKKLWSITHEEMPSEKIVIGVALHNNKATIRSTLESILNQINVKRQLWVMICDDDSDDVWKNEVSDLLDNDRVIYWKKNYHNVSKVRNFINEFITEYFDNVSLIGRLDSDDVYAGNDVIAKIESIKEEANADFIIAGNYLKQNGQILARVNRATPELLNRQYLLNRLKEMAEGAAVNELPSCNLFMTPEHIQVYPDKESAEDHFVCSKVLWNKEKLKVVTAPDVLLTVYNLNGSVTKTNKNAEIYFSARKDLYNEVLKYEE